MGKGCKKFQFFSNSSNETVYGMIMYWNLQILCMVLSCKFSDISHCKSGDMGFTLCVNVSLDENLF